MEGIDHLAPKSDYADEATEAMNLFHSTLANLVPVFQKTEVKWNMLDSNDDFYSLAEALYNIIVITKFEALAEAKHLDPKEFAHYGFFHKTLADLNYIEVVSPDYPNSILAFDYVASKNSPFDVIYCHRLNEQGAIIDRDLEVGFTTSTFNFRFR